ncbi:MAG: transposase, partial [Erysipelotrichaceae bacterium]|nr:transposase [Erysipelotrichaceae bacterium]
MDGPIITVDVSKGNCHYQPFLEKGKPLRKPKILYDTIEGFEELQKSIDQTEEKSGSKVSVIFEATGVYHRCLQKYLDDHDIPYYIISPLLSAKYRQTNLHANKTDALDCGHIAKAYYGDERLYVFEKQEDRFIV